MKCTIKEKEPLEEDLEDISSEEEDFTEIKKEELKLCLELLSEIELLLQKLLSN